MIKLYIINKKKEKKKMMYDLPNLISCMDVTKVGAATDPDNCKAKLFKPITIKNITIKNRIFVAPM